MKRKERKGGLRRQELSTAPEGLSKLKIQKLIFKHPRGQFVEKLSAVRFLFHESCEAAPR